MKVLNMSSTRPLQWSTTTPSASSLTSVMNTMGLWPSRSAASLISRTTCQALSAVSMKGRRTWRGLPENWFRIELPKFSAVMPVPSETKNTVRLGMGYDDGVAPAAMIGGQPLESAAIPPDLPMRPSTPQPESTNGGSAAVCAFVPRTTGPDCAGAPVSQHHGAFPCL